MSVKENLIAARAMISDEGNWCKHEYNARPGCFCALGAVAAAMGIDPDDKTTQEDRALAAALGSFWASDVADYNDDDATTHADVLALFDKAIGAQE